MKNKLLIIASVVIIFVILVLISLAYVGNSGTVDKKISDLEIKKSENGQKIRETILQVATSKISIFVDDFYQKNPTQGFVENDADTKMKINSYLEGIKSSNGGFDIEYYIHTSKSDYVVKTREKGAPIYYCMDFVSEDVRPKIVNEIENSFSKPVDCNGLIMK